MPIRSAKCALTLVLSLVVATLPACSTNEDSITGTDITLAELNLVASADPIEAQASPDADYQWLAAFTTDLTEVAGTDATIEIVQATLSEASGGIVVVGSEEEEVQVSFSSPTNDLPGDGTVTLSFDILYTLPGGGREAVIDIAVQVADANGYAVQATLRVNVA